MSRIAIVALNGSYTSSLCKLLDLSHIANQLIRSATATDSNAAAGGSPLRQLPVQPITWKVISIDGQSPQTTERVPVTVDLSLAAAGDQGFDVVFVPALDYPDTATFLNRLKSFKPLYPWLLRQRQQGAVIASICTGTLVLAEAGLLDRRSGTTSWWLEKQFHRRYPAVKLDVSQDVSEDDRVLCGGALSANVQLSLRLIELLTNPAIAAMTAKSVLSSATELPGVAAEATLCETDDLVARTQHWFQKNLSKKIKLAEVAASMLVSERTLIRHFKKTLGVTPHTYLQGIRMDSAKTMLESTNLRIDKVAERVGYGDIAFFQQVFRGHAGVTPTGYRKNCVASRAPSAALPC